MPLDKLMRTPASEYTSLMRKQILNDHKHMHGLYVKTLSSEHAINRVFLKKLEKIHEMIAKKFKALGVDHNQVDNLDKKLPEELVKQLTGIYQGNSEGPVALVRMADDASDASPRGEVWIKDGNFYLKSTDQDLLQAWKDYAVDVVFYDFESNDSGTFVNVRQPDNALEGLEALDEAFWDSDYYLDYMEESMPPIGNPEANKAWSEAARAASAEARRAAREERGQFKRERPQPYKGVGKEYVNKNLKIVEKGASADFTKQVLSTLPKEHIDALDVVSVVVHSKEDFVKEGKGHLGVKEGGVLWLVPRGVGGRGGLEAANMELHVNGHADSKTEKHSILRAVGRAQLTSLSPDQATRIYSMMGKPQTNFVRQYVKAYTMFAVGAGSRAKLERSTPNVHSWFKMQFGMKVGKSLETVKQQANEDIAKYDDKQLRAIHYSLHNHYRQWEETKKSWDNFSTLEDWVNYHVRLVLVMKERGIMHGGVDSLDERARELEGEVKSLTSGFEERYPWTLDKVRDMASLSKHLRGTRILELGCGSGRFLDLMAASGAEPQGIDTDEAMIKICEEQGLPAMKHDALEYLKAQGEASWDTVCSLHFLEHNSNYKDILIESARVAKFSSVHVVPLGARKCGDHKVAWSDFYGLKQDLIGVGSGINLIELADHTALIEIQLDLTPIVRPFTSMGDFVLIPNFVNLVGSSVKADGQADVPDYDMVIREQPRNMSLELQLRNQLKLSGFTPNLEYVYNPAGPHGDFIPLYDLVCMRKPLLEKEPIKVSEEFVKSITPPKNVTTWIRPLKPADSYDMVSDVWDEWAQKYIKDGIHVEWKADGIRCLSYHEKITMWDGSRIRIDKLVKEKIRAKIKSRGSSGLICDDEVIGWSGEDGSRKKWVSLHVGAKGDGKCIFVTDDHYIPTVRGLKRVKDLSLEDYLFTEGKMLNPTQKAVCVGTVLGDSCMSRDKRCFSNPRLHLMQSVKQKSYLVKKLKLFRPFLLRKVYNYETGFGGRRLNVQSRSLAALNEIYNGFYCDNKRSINQDFLGRVGNELTLAILYMDDGSLRGARDAGYKTKNLQSRARLHVNGLSDEDRNTIRMWLREKWSVEAVEKEDGRGKKGKHLEFHADDSQRFFGLVAQYIPEELEYKLPSAYRGGRKIAWWEESALRDGILTEPITMIKVLSWKYRAYDIQTKRSNLFFANGILVHNSHLVKDGDKVLYQSNNPDQEYHSKFPHVTEEILKNGKLPERFVIDAECLQYNSKGQIEAREESTAMVVGKEPNDQYAVFWAFDCLFDGKDWLLDKTYDVRRVHLSKLGLGSMDHIKIMPTTVVRSKDALNRAIEEVSKHPASEGAVFKASNSIYDKSGSTHEWAKHKVLYDIACRVVEVNPTTVGTYTYAVEISDGKGGFVPAANTMATGIHAKKGDIIEVRVLRAYKKDDGTYSFLLPRVIEIRNDITIPQSVKRADWIIDQTARADTKKMLFIKIFNKVKTLVEEKWKVSLEEERQAKAEDTIGMIKEGDKAPFVMQIHDVRTLHMDWRLSLAHVKHTFAGFQLYIPKKLRREHEGEPGRTIRETGNAVIEHLLGGGTLAGSYKTVLGPDTWVKLAHDNMVTFQTGGVGASPNLEGHMLACEWGTYEAGAIMKGGHHSMAFKLNGKKIKNRWMLVVGIKAGQMRQGSQLEAGEGRVWFFRLLKEGSEPVSEKDEEKKKTLTQRVNEKSGKKEWCLVSKRDPSKILEWFGTEKPSDKKVAKSEARINYFKHKSLLSWKCPSCGEILMATMEQALDRMVTCPKCGQGMEEQKVLDKRIKCRECDWVGMSSEGKIGNHGIRCPKCGADLVHPETGVLEA